MHELHKKGSETTWAARMLFNDEGSAGWDVGTICYLRSNCTRPGLLNVVE